MKKITRKLKNKIHHRQAKKAAKRYGHPERELKIIGVTGTDGKTTTTSMIYHILNNCGFDAGYISTTVAKIGDEVIETGLHVTTPDPWVLPMYLRKMADKGIEYAVVETTSMGLDQNRLGDIRFDAAVITNIGEDHLDYHGSWENYARAKFKLIQRLKEESVAIINQDDEQSAEWIQKQSSQIRQNIYVKWSTVNAVQNLKLKINSLDFDYKGERFSIPILGAMHNLENVLQAIMLCESLLPLSEISEALKDFKLPSGRMELMSYDPIKIIVDFAHTPDALAHALKAVRNVLPDGKRLITVFGCAGKRDKGRRRMGLVSAQLSDITLLTAEDPRNEKLAQINNEIFSHAKKVNSKLITRFQNHDDYALTSLGEIHAEIETAWKHNTSPFLMFDEDNRNSRKDAIELGIRLARRGDCVFITGKGHEKSLAFGKKEKEFAWSDQEEVRLALKRLRISVK